MQTAVQDVSTSGGAVWQAFTAISNAVASATHIHPGHCVTCIDFAQLLH